MVKINLDGCRPFVGDNNYVSYLDKAVEAYGILDNETGEGNDFLGWKHLPSGTPDALVCQFEAIRDEWLRSGIDTVVVIGIGGSYLGAKCAIEALSHAFQSRLGRKEGGMDVVFAGNNLSEDYLAELLDLMLRRSVAAVVISKSGTTTEPAVAFRLVKNFIEDRYGKDEAARRIVAVTDKAKGALKKLSDTEGYRTFVIEDNVGGRFSVLTPVGLLPIMLAGYDVRAMLEGAREAEKACSSASKDNPAIQYAAMRNLLYSKGYKIELLVSFNPKLTYLGEWWKQLFGESEGKDGKGIFPASANFTTDLHSMGQYIQDGERILIETTVSVGNSNRKLMINTDPDNLDGLNFIASRRVEECNRMAELGTRLAHMDGGVPQMQLLIERIDEFNLGSMFYFFEMSCGISAYILGVNPFNQPGVEAYKKNMFALLGKPGYEEEAALLRERLEKMKKA